MAMDIGNLGDEIKAEIEALYGTPQDSQRLQDFCDAIAKAVVLHIQNNAQVSSSGTAVVSSGSSSGSWPTTTTGTIS